MAAVDKIRSRLVDKMRAIENKDTLEALDKLVAPSSSSSVPELIAEQKELLKMSDKDIKNGRLISQYEMKKRNLEWLNGY